MLPLSITQIYKFFSCLIQKSVVFLFLFLFQATLFAQSEFSVYFDSDSAVLHQKMIEVIESSLRPINAKKYQFLLQGYTDNTGNETENKKLSFARANAVKKYLISKGIDSSFIETTGWSARNPVASNSTTEGKALNRRVEISLLPRSAEVIAEQYRFNSETGGFFIYKRSGTAFSIPARALMYRDGRPAKGEILITYREFRDAADFIVSGIPMTYDSAGTVYHFNSAGMFEIHAFQNNEELFLRKNQNIPLTLAQSATVFNPNLYAFDTIRQEWSFRNSLNNKIGIANPKGFLEGPGGPGGEENFNEDSPAKRCLLDMDLSCKDTCEGIKLALEMGKKFASQKEPIPYLLSDGSTFEARYQNPHYNGIYFHKNDPEKKELHYPIRIQLQKKKSKGLNEFTIQDVTGEHTELSSIKGISWLCLKSDQEALSTATSQYWSDIRVKKDSANVVTLTLKGATQSLELHAIPKFNLKKVKTRNVISEWNAAQEKYLPLLKERENQFNDSLQNQVTLNEQLICFYHFSKLFTENETELCKSAEEWFDYFDEHKNLMKERYAKFFDHYYHRDCEKLLALSKEKIKAAQREIRRMEWIRQGGYPTSTMTEEERIEYANNQQQSLRDLANTVIGWQNQKSLDAGHTFPKQIQQLFLDGFGIWNSDQIMILGNVVTIRPSYKDENGNEIKGKVLSMVDKKINGAMSFDPKTISFNPASQNVFLLFDHQDQKYILREDAIKKLHPKNGEAIVLQMENITQKTKTVATLRKALQLK